MTKNMAMLEDFWLPRREGGRGTEISTLPGGQNLGEITDIEYFKRSYSDHSTSRRLAWMAKADLISEDLLKSSETN